MPKDIEERIVEMVSEIIDLLGEEAEVTHGEREGALLVDIELENPGPLIGRGGRGLDALQLIIYRMARRRWPEETLPSIVIDINGYRKEREELLAQMARDIAARVRRSGESVLLEPMNAWERRVIHMSVREEGDIETESEDSDEGRRVRIAPVEADEGEEGEREEDGEME